MQLIAFAMTWFLVRTRSERGQDLIEYAMLGGLIALALIAVGTVVFVGALDGMAGGIGRCIDFKKSTACDPF